MEATSCPIGTATLAPDILLAAHLISLKLLNKSTSLATVCTVHWDHQPDMRGGPE